MFYFPLKDKFKNRSKALSGLSNSIYYPYPLPPQKKRKHKKVMKALQKESVNLQGKNASCEMDAFSGYSSKG